MMFTMATSKPMEAKYAWKRTSGSSVPNLEKTSQAQIRRRIWVGFTCEAFDETLAILPLTPIAFAPRIPRSNWEDIASLGGSLSRPFAVVKIDAGRFDFPKDGKIRILFP
jgi:hypothetical protein